MHLIGFKFYNLKSLQMLRSFLKSAKHFLGTLVLTVVPLIGLKFCNL